MPRINLLSLRPTFPPILTLPSKTTGNNVPKSLHKTRRTWKPNVHRLDVQMNVVETARKASAGTGVTKGEGGFVLKGVKMDMRSLRSFKKAGGVEGCLLSRPSKHFTPFGKQLRGDLFKRLIAIRDGQLAATGTVDV